MARAKMIVLAAAMPGQKLELDQWYDKRHIPDILAVPGIQSCERFDFQGMGPGDAAQKWDYVGIYDIEADDVGAVLKDMGGRMGTERMPKSPALDSSRTLAFIAHAKPTAK
jgi:hypothetical protein